MCLEHWQKALGDKAFMGTTHALSGFAVFLALVAFAPAIAEWAGFTSPAIIVLAAVVVAGAALIPDLDNTTSTAKNSLGLLGEGLSIVFRGSATAIQTVVRGPRDDANVDPHRGFWHTIPASIILGVLVWLLTAIQAPVFIPFIGDVTFGWIGAVVVAFICIHMAFAGLFGKIIKKVIRGSAGFESALTLATSVAVLALFWFIPRDENFWWLSIAVAMGAILHILGDAFTTAGVPLTFPIPVKGKLWWKTRFLPIKAGGTVENYVFMPAFALITVGSVFFILFRS